MRSSQASIVELDKGKRYRVFVECGRDVDTGKRKRLTKTVRGSRREAERVKLELLIQAGSMGVVSDLTVSEYCENVFMPSKRRELSSGAIKLRTYESYEDRIECHIVPLFGSKLLVELSPVDIRNGLRCIESLPTQREVRKMLHTICQCAVYDGHLASNPVSAVKPPKASAYQPDVLSEDEIRAYMEHFKGKRSEPAVLLAMCCGLRRGEIAALDRCDIDFDKCTVTVSKSVLDARTDHAHLDTPKSITSNRTIHIPESVCRRLDEITVEGAVCRKQDGSRMAPSYIRTLYRRELATMDESIPRISLKNLRHTALTMAYDKLGDILAVARHGGHAAPDVTIKHYVRPHDDRDKALAKAVDESLSCQSVPKLVLIGDVEEF